MLTHMNADYKKPDRVVLLGGSGFVGKAVSALLKEEAIDVASFSSADIDLSTEAGAVKLATELKEGDSLVVLSALTPDKGKGIDTFMKNLRMVEGVCSAVQKTMPAHIVYFSSDAVYPMTENPVSEESAAAPGDLYGAMHLAREIMLKSAVADRLCILRPTLIYGAGDTHSSYGPNRFRRVAAADGKITIGGEGEETRDHIYVADVAALVRLVLGHKSTGLLNVATGVSTDFGTLARMVAALFDTDVPVKGSPRGSAITHRKFDITACRKAFPAFAFTPLDQGLALAQKDVE
ncbi:NAD-dependent epimerase/dehydratase family protein [Kordiimonas pumila]|uniref:NAD-dependent epimerase/dehydratase family protein n=1 Tax=Kordiimonas pumila TaxID=2161677 RepID=A0ABV7DA17_9PROT|nr:NAD(P)-dependent oxidoreductase [Kordiimonas pumila]